MYKIGWEYIFIQGILSSTITKLGQIYY